jgi:beta-lactam-binding protein with PASTA domain
MMDFKERFHGSFWFNFLLVSLSFTVIYIVFFQTLSCFTHHGEMVKLPNLRGKSITEAEKILHDMHFEVQIDSTFEPTAASLAVLKQVPDSGAVVKTGRIVMLTVNSITALRVPMPNLVNLSLRSAELLLRSNKMYIGDTTYVPDIARGAVKEQRYKGEIVRPGELIPQGSKIDLIIGNGFGNQVFDVPDVVGRTVDEAMTIINQYNLIPNLYVNDIVGGMITDTFDAKIIKQTPTPLNEKGEHNKIKMGELIDLCIKQHPEPEDYNNKQIVPPSANTETTEPVPTKKINKREDE